METAHPRNLRSLPPLFLFFDTSTPATPPHCRGTTFRRSPRPSSSCFQLERRHRYNPPHLILSRHQQNDAGAPFQNPFGSSARQSLTQSCSQSSNDNLLIRFAASIRPSKWFVLYGLAFGMIAILLSREHVSAISDAVIGSLHDRPPTSLNRSNSSPDLRSLRRVRTSSLDSTTHATFSFAPSVALLALR